MSQRKASTKRGKPKVFAAVVLLMAIGYFYGRPTLENWLGQPLLPFGTNGAETVGNNADTNRTVGYEGGQSGKRKNFPQLKRIRLVIEQDSQLVTAYPFR